MDKILWGLKDIFYRILNMKNRFGKRKNKIILAIEKYQVNFFKKNYQTRIYFLNVNFVSEILIKTTRVCLSAIDYMKCKS